MSTRKRVKSLRRGRRTVTRSEDDLPLSVLVISNTASAAAKKKTTPRKRTTRKVMAAPTPTELTTIDDIPERAEIMNNVNTKIGDFIQSGSFMSSDDDETETVKPKAVKKSSSDSFFISDDSDDEYKKTSGTAYINTSEPSTSAGTSRDTFKENNPKNADDDIMGFVDSVLNSNNTEVNKQDNLKDMKSLEDFRKETEEMLKNASTLLDEIKTGRKAEPEPKKEEASPSKVTVGACPICLDNLGGCPAAVTVCGHIFCKECITQTAQTLKKCPTCRKAINLKKIHPIYF